jgi:exosortase family protein XrtF
MSPAFKFILIFGVSYLLMSGLYQLVIWAAAPGPDIFTILVAQILPIFIDGIELHSFPSKSGIQIWNNQGALVNIMEGCNGMAVWITLLSFTLAFTGKPKTYLWFLPLSFLLLQIGNILRLITLIQFKIQKPELFEIFHTYLFPAILYAFAFGLMVWWVKLSQLKLQKQ